MDLILKSKPKKLIGYCDEGCRRYGYVEVSKDGQMNPSRCPNCVQRFRKNAPKDAPIPNHMGEILIVGGDDIDFPGNTRVMITSLENLSLWNSSEEK